MGCAAAACSAPAAAAPDAAGATELTIPPPACGLASAGTARGGVAASATAPLQGAGVGLVSQGA